MESRPRRGTPRALTLLEDLHRAVSRLTATGAAANARLEADRTTKSVADIEAQLSVVSDPTPRRAA